LRKKEAVVDSVAQQIDVLLPSLKRYALLVEPTLK
jgi:hypothetical protein